MRLVAWTLVLAACEPMTPTGNPLAPVRPAVAPRTSTSSPDPMPSAEPDAFDFGEDEGTDKPTADVPDDPAALLALAQGKPIPAPAPIAPAPSVAPAPMPGSVLPAAPLIPLWDPSSTGSADWGVHLVSTLLDTQPPMAVMGLPDGQTVVVRPGSFLADRQLVVMAIGRDAVQVAKVVPDGYRARIETRTLGALFPPGGSVRLSTEP